MRKEGLEPPQPFGHQLLRLARLPIPPLPHRLALRLYRFANLGSLQIRLPCHARFARLRGQRDVWQACHAGL